MIKNFTTYFMTIITYVLSVYFSFSYIFMKIS